MFITYTSSEEVIVCTAGTEEDVLRAWFEDGERDMDDYDREEIEDKAVTITANLRVY